MKHSKKTLTFPQIASRLWASAVMARHRKKDTAGNFKYPPRRIQKNEFTAWLLAQSDGGKGECWTCRYSGRKVKPFVKSNASRMTIDHVVPLSKGGHSHVDNLAVCGQTENRIKADLALESYLEHRRLMDRWTEKGREDDVRSVNKRLARPAYGRGR